MSVKKHFLQQDITIDFGILADYNPDHKIGLKFMLAEQKERNPRAKFTRAKTLGCKNGFAF